MLKHFVTLMNEQMFGSVLFSEIFYSVTYHCTLSSNMFMIPCHSEAHPCALNKLKFIGSNGILFPFKDYEYVIYVRFT